MVRLKDLLGKAHNLMLSSAPPEASNVPSAENAREKTVSVCPVMLPSSSPSATRHNLISPLLLPDATTCPSGETATEITRIPWFKVPTGAPSDTRQSLTVRSRPPETNSAPSGVKATPVVPLECAATVRINSPSATRKKYRFWCKAAVPTAKICPSGEKAAQFAPPKRTLSVRNNARPAII